jgi:HEPN domain-containing protein
MASAQEYRDAARERLGDCRVLAEHARWSGTIYLAGRATEAMLKALLRTQSREDETGHDLRILLKSVDQTGLLEGNDRDKLQQSLNELSQLWANRLRFADDRLVLSEIKRKKMDRGIKGDVLKYFASRLLEHSEAILHRGELIWARSKKN